MLGLGKVGRVGRKRLGDGLDGRLDFFCHQRGDQPGSMTQGMLYGRGVGGEQGAQAAEDPTYRDSPLAGQSPLPLSLPTRAPPSLRESPRGEAGR